jgi:hypothetical protein
MIALYARAARACRTVNDLNRLHIALENRITPLELDALRRGADPPAPQWARLVGGAAARVRRSLDRPGRLAAPSRPPYDWVARLHALAAKAAAPPQPFRRERLHGRIARYSAGGDRSRKTLAVCFAGRAQRLMMPLPVFLQHVDASVVDVAFLRDPAKEGYRAGIGRGTRSLDDLLERLPSRLSFDAYARVVTIGTSGGGLPAVLAAVQLGLPAALAAGPNGPDDPRWQSYRGVGVRRVLEESATARGDRRPAITLVVGAGAPKDQAAAQTLARIIPARIIVVDGVRTAAGHNALLPLVERGELASLLRSSVFAV